jgi:hypothetical protein
VSADGDGLASHAAPELLADLAGATTLTAELSVTLARAAAREIAWAGRAEATGVAFGRSRVAGAPGLDVLVIDLDAHVLVCHSEMDTSGRNTSSPPTAQPATSAARPAAASVTTAELRQSRQNSLPSGSVITMKPALIGGAGS